MVAQSILVTKIRSLGLLNLPQGGKIIIDQTNLKRGKLSGEMRILISNTVNTWIPDEKILLQRIFVLDWGLLVGVGSGGGVGWGYRKRGDNLVIFIFIDAQPLFPGATSY